MSRFLWYRFSYHFLFQTSEDQPVGRLEANRVRSFGYPRAFNSRADNTVINYCNLFRKFKAWCLHCGRGLSFLPATPMTVSSYLHTLLEMSLSSSSVHNAFYAINWIHNFAGYDSPCNTFLAKSIAEASSRISRKPVRKTEPITPEILSSFCKCYGDSEGNS